MAEPATNVTGFGSKLADRISAWALENPEATEYCINEELEARELLIVIASAIKMLTNDMPRDHYRALAIRYRSDMLKAAAQGRAIEYIRNQLNIDEPIEFIGLKITVPELTMQ